MTDAELPQLERVPTGVAGLDRMLNGGLLRGGSYVLVGTPGAGKTILSNQICFHHVATGGRAIYVTVLAEAHARLISHIRPFTFFREEPLADTLQYFSAFATVEQHGLEGLLDLLRGEVRNMGATLLVIDGLSTLESFVESSVSYKRFLTSLQTTLDLLGCTLMLQIQPLTDPRFMPVFTLVDGVITLWDRTEGVRAIREIEIQKLRGSDHLRGRHQFVIAEHGISVHPRTEMVLQAVPSAATLPPPRQTFNLQRMDEMFGGGLIEGSSTLLLGPPGSGKTLLSLHFLSAGIAHEQSALYFGFYEAPPQIITTAQQVGIDFTAALSQNLLQIRWQVPVNALVDVFAEQILALVDQRNVKRLVIDGLGGFQAAAVYPERMAGFLAALVNELRARGVTTIFTVSLPDLLTPEIRVPIDGGGEVVDNVVFMRYVELRSQLYRLISIIKMRESAYDRSIREFTITSAGIDVAETFESAEAILTGIARPSTAPAPRTRKSSHPRAG